MEYTENNIFLKINQVSLAYKKWGESKEVVLLLLHGWLGNANSFDLLVPFFSNQMTVYVPLFQKHLGR